MSATLSRSCRGRAPRGGKARAAPLLGLDRPILVQYGQFLGRIATGDLGISYRNQRPVDGTARRAAARHLGTRDRRDHPVAGGGHSGRSSLRPQDRMACCRASSRALSLVGISTPTFVTGIVLILVFAVGLRVLPSFGRGDVVRIGWWTTGFLTSSGLKSLILPGDHARALSAHPHHASRARRDDRRAVVATTSASPGRAASRRATSIPAGLRNALMPVITVTGLQIGSLIAFAIVTETVFQWPGMGLLFIQAVSFVDIPVMAAYLLFVGLMFVVINMVGRHPLRGRRSPASREVRMNTLVVAPGLVRRLGAPISVLIAGDRGRRARRRARCSQPGSRRRPDRPQPSI